MKRGKPINLRPGRTTVVKLPSGEEIALELEQMNGHLLLRITAPEGSQIDHRKAFEFASAATVQSKLIFHSGSTPLGDCKGSGTLGGIA